MSALLDGTPESWLTLFLALSVAFWPAMVWAGMVWGRMNAEDEMIRLKRRSLSLQRELEEQ